MNCRTILKRALVLAVPMMIQNGITNAVGLVDHIMVGSLGTEAMTAVSIVGQLLFVFALALFGGVSGPGIYTAQFHGQGNLEGVKSAAAELQRLLVKYVDFDVAANGDIYFGLDLPTISSPEAVTKLYNKIINTEAIPESIKLKLLDLVNYSGNDASGFLGTLTYEELLTELRTLVGGRAAEQVVFGTMTNGASNDIQKATSLARHMVSLYGMSEELGLMATASVHSQYLDGQAHMDCSQETAFKVDMAVQNILNRCYADAKRILTENRTLLDEISEFLLVKETITGDELMAFVNKTPSLETTEETEE